MSCHADVGVEQHVVFGVDLFQGFVISFGKSPVLFESDDPA